MGQWHLRRVDTETLVCMHSHREVVQGAKPACILGPGGPNTTALRKKALQLESTARARKAPSGKPSTSGAKARPLRVAV
eukprot:CAMPEP_0180806044 /NCGR_PEP_ID=MMETSP1038_2-20121128/62368_1 /TAXON_ID=632150 /ORGANISM="Azadinium spinosum, Strain 3D9" /LENGTH=78 /DNA_ID=CAMNT_0022846695 /DNA_START=199 /DNA_END=436 /DNA_ORIENTATION=+